MTTYPRTAGYKEETTSREAAERIEATGRASTIRGTLLAEMEAGWMGTAFDAAEMLGIPYHSVQPRFSELLNQGKIRKAYRTKGPNGTSVWVWGAEKVKVE
jgi:hypothetical protein